MTTSSMIMKSLPMVASVLGHKYGVEVRIGGDEAFTNGKIIQLPSMPLEYDEIFLGLARGYIDHESAHIRETHFGWLRMAELNPLEMHIWNILEDWRVENRLSIRFPGCRRNFDWLIRHLFGKEKEEGRGNVGASTAILNWLLLSVRMWDVPELASRRNKSGELVERHYAGLLDKLRVVLSQVRERCESTQDCILFARKIVAILKKMVEPRSSEEQALGNATSHSELSAHARNNLNKLLCSSAGELPKSTSEILAETLSGRLPDKRQQRFMVAQRGRKRVRELSPELLAQSHRASAALRTRLHGLIQAKTIKRNRVGRKGILCPNLLHRVAVCNPRLFRKHEQAQTLNTAVHILLDCSGSMRKRMLFASQVCHAVAYALSAMNGVNVAVSVFPATSPVNPTLSYTPLVCPVLGHGERMHNRFGIAASGNTPLGEALWWVFQNMVVLSEKRKIILVLTDGAPDNLEAAEEAIGSGQRLGYEIYGLGVSPESMPISQLLPENSRVLSELSDLAEAMFELLREALLNK